MATPDRAAAGETGKRIPEPPPERPRFYTDVTVEADETGFRVLLDGRTVRTPARGVLRLPTAPLAEAVAAEWRAQETTISPATMPMTRIVNSCLDGVATNPADVADDIVKYAGTDLLCYRAEGPDALVRRQAAAWDPLLSWAEERLGGRFVLAEGVMPVAQSEALLSAFRARLPSTPLPLGALHVVTTLTGSAVIALALAERRVTLEEAWEAAHVDEDWNIALWGEDAEAAERRARRKREAAAAERILAEAP